MGILAKQALKLDEVNINVPLCKAEGKSIIQEKVIGMWQEQWDSNDTGRHLYCVKRNVGGVDLGMEVGEKRQC